MSIAECRSHIFLTGEARLTSGSLYRELLHSVSAISLLKGPDPRVRDHYEHAILQGGKSLRRSCALGRDRRMKLQPTSMAASWISLEYPFVETELSLIKFP